MRKSVFGVSDQVFHKKMARGLKFWIYEVAGLYLYVAEKKALISCSALRICFHICKEQVFSCRVATVREKSLENEIFSRSGKSQGISILVREI